MAREIRVVHKIIAANVSTKTGDESNGKGCFDVSYHRGSFHTEVMIEAEDGSGKVPRRVLLDLNREGVEKLRAALSEALDGSGLHLAKTDEDRAKANGSVRGFSVERIYGERAISVWAPRGKTFKGGRQMNEVATWKEAFDLVMSAKLVDAKEVR